MAWGRSAGAAATGALNGSEKGQTRSLGSLAQRKAQLLLNASDNGPKNPGKEVIKLTALPQKVKMSIEANRSSVHSLS